MMSKQWWSVLALAASLAVTAGSIIFAESLPFAVLLISIAVLLVLATAGWTAWEWLPRIFTDPERPQVVARSIYRSAAAHGGTIHATHVFPKVGNPDDDYAIAELSNLGRGVKLSFHRVLLLDSIEDERNWLQLLFQRLHPSIVKRFYTLSSYPLLLPRIAKALLPRLNLLLYRSPAGACQALVGLDRLHVTGNTVNYAVRSRSKRVYGALLEYFELLTGSRHFQSSSNLSEYNATQRVTSEVQKGQAVVSRVVDCAETTEGIVFVGLFGSIARAALGLRGEVLGKDDNDADVDLLLLFNPDVYTGTEEHLQRQVESALDTNRTHVTWGPDLDVFYPFRDEQRIDVDVECLPIGSDFYHANHLLGYSIFRYFLPLYSLEQRAVTSYIRVPMVPLSQSERWNAVVADRQGLEYFMRRVSGKLSGTDPRRLCSHVLRNVVWAVTGSWPTTGRSAGALLTEIQGWRVQPAIPRAVSLLGRSTAEVRNDRQGAFDEVRELIDCILRQSNSEEGQS
jgi:predicted nucleotidyltransferase